MDLLVLRINADTQGTKCEESQRKAILGFGTNGVLSKVYFYETPQELPEASANLKYAFIIFEHGIRTPLYDVIPQSDDRKPHKGKGSLTTIGKQLMMHVGSSLRYRYHSVAPLFDESKVLVTTLASNRNNMAAEVVAQGMFPSPGQPLIPELPGWQPIPVWEVTYDKSRLFEHTHDYTNIECPSYVKLRDNYMSDEKNREKLSRRWFYKNLYNKLEGYISSIKKGYHGNSVTSLEGNYKVWDTLKMKKLNRRSTPDWLDIYMNSMESLALLRVWSAVHSMTNMINFYTGTIFNEILQSIEENLNKPKKGAFIHLHSSRDVTLSALAWSLGQQETYLAQPGDTLMLEVNQDNTVELFLFSPLQENAKYKFGRLTLFMLCGEDPCKLKTFQTKLAAIAQGESDWKIKCYSEVNGVPRKEPKTSLTLRSVLGI